MYLNLHLPTGIHVWILKPPQLLRTHTQSHTPTPTHAHTHTPSRRQWVLREVTCPPVNPRGEPSLCKYGSGSHVDCSYGSTAGKQRQTEEKMGREMAEGGRTSVCPTFSSHTHTYIQTARQRGCCYRCYLSGRALPLRCTHTHTQTSQSGTVILLAVQPLPPADLDERWGRGKLLVNDS